MTLPVVINVVSGPIIAGTLPFLKMYCLALLANTLPFQIDVVSGLIARALPLLTNKVFGPL